jgi:hypothetical protein
MSYDQYKLASLQELGTSPRLGGCYRGGANGIGQTCAIWRGRPPTLENQAGSTPRILSLAARTTGTLGPGTVTSIDILAECGNAFGGIIQRRFTVGEGLSADLAVGSYKHVRVVTESDVPPNTTLFFCWVDDLPGSNGSARGLVNFLDYPVAGVRTRAPEGAFLMYPENACQITFTMVENGTTFVVAANANEAIPVHWGTFSANAVTKFVFKLRSF